MRPPQPQEEPERFESWALMHVERALKPEDEHAFERLLADSPVAAAAYVRVVQFDTDLHEQLEASPLLEPRVRSIRGEPLDPHNMAHMAFVAEVIRELAEPAQHARHTRFWVWGGLLAALLAVAVGLSWWYFSMNSAPATVVGVPSPAQEYKPIGVEPSPVQVAEIAPVRASTISEGSVEPAPVVQALAVERGVAQPETVSPDVTTEGMPEPEIIATAVPPDQVSQLRVSPPTLVLAAPVQSLFRLDADIWLPLGSLRVERNAVRMRVILQHTEDNTWNRGGLLYSVPFKLDGRLLSLSLQASGPLLSNALHDFEFIVADKPRGGTRICLPLKRVDLQALRGRVNLEAAEHQLELVVWRQNRFEIRVDGSTFYLESGGVDPTAWPEVYLGFRATTQNTKPGEALYIEKVQIGYVKADEKRR